MNLQEGDYLGFRWRVATPFELALLTVEARQAMASGAFIFWLTPDNVIVVTEKPPKEIP